MNRNSPPPPHRAGQHTFLQKASCRRLPSSKVKSGRKARRPGPAYLSTSKPALHHSPQVGKGVGGGTEKAIEQEDGGRRSQFCARRTMTHLPPTAPASTPFSRRHLADACKVKSCGRKARRPGPAYLSTSKPALHHSPISTLWYAVAVDWPTIVRAHEDKAAPAMSSIGQHGLARCRSDQGGPWEPGHGPAQCWGLHGPSRTLVPTGCGSRMQLHGWCVPNSMEKGPFVHLDFCQFGEVGGVPSSARLLLAFVSTSCRAARSCTPQRPVRLSGPRPRGARKPKPQELSWTRLPPTTTPRCKMSKPSSMSNPAALQAAPFQRISPERHQILHVDGPKWQRCRCLPSWNLGLADGAGPPCHRYRYADALLDLQLPRDTMLPSNSIDFVRTTSDGARCPGRVDPGPRRARSRHLDCQHMVGQVADPHRAPP